MFEQYLLETFGYNEPIFVNELNIPDMSENAVRQAIKRLAASGFCGDLIQAYTIFLNHRNY